MQESTLEQFTSIASPTKLDMLQCPVYVTVDGSRRIFKSYFFGPVGLMSSYFTLAEALINMGPNDEMRIVIDSPGGYVSSGAQIASLIHACEGKVITEARGMAASAAALVHSSAKKEYQEVHDGSILMYHMSSGLSTGFSTDILAGATEQVRYVTECLLSKAVDDNHITKDELGRIASASDEIYITGEEFKRRNAGEQPQEAPPTEEVVGTESFYSNNVSMTDTFPMRMSTAERQRLDSRMAQNGDPRAQMQPVICFSSNDKGGKSYRIYNAFNSWCRTDDGTVRRMCAFLDNLGANDDCIFILGSDEEDGVSYSMGSIIATATIHKDKVGALALGPCSTAETMLWSQLSRREVGRYGYLRFSYDKTLCAFRPVFKQYYLNSFNAALKTGILTENEVNDIIENNKLITLHYFDYQKRIEK